MLLKKIFFKIKSIVEKDNIEQLDSKLKEIFSETISSKLTHEKNLN